MAPDSEYKSRGPSQLSQATIRTLERVDVEAGPLAKFWDRYWGSEEGTAAVIDGVLTLASSVDTEQVEPYIVREDYIKAMREVVVAHSRGESNSFVGYGQPGIGKSIFLRILLALCFELRIPVIYGAVDESSATLFTNDGVFELPHEKVKRCTFVEPPIVLLDAAGKEPVPSAWYTNKRFTIFLSSSPAEYRYAELVGHRPTTFINFSLWRRYELVHFLVVTARSAADPPAKKVPCTLASYVFPTSLTTDGSKYIVTNSHDGDALVPPHMLPNLKLVSPPADVLEYWNCRASARNHYGPLETFDVLGPRIRTVIDGVKIEQGDLIRDGVKRVAPGSVVRSLPDATAALSAGTPVPAESQKVGFYKIFYEMPTQFLSEGQPAVILIIPSAQLHKLFLDGAQELEKVERDRLYVQLRSHRSLLCYTYESMALHHISHAGFIADDLTVPPLPLRQFDPRRDLPVDSNYIATMPPNYPTFDAVVVLPSRSAFVFLQITISNNHDYPASGVENVKNTVGDAVWRSWTKFFVLCSKTEKAALTLVTSLEAKMKPPTDPKKLKTWKKPAAFLYESTILPLAITDDDMLGSLEGHVIRHSPPFPQNGFEGSEDMEGVEQS